MIVASALAFTLASVLVAQLIGALFNLIGLEIVQDIVQRSWFILPWGGASLGVALGLLREKQKWLGTLQNLVMIVFSVLTPVMAAALVIFLVAIVFTGLDTLWATGHATAILLACGAAAVFFINVVLRNNAQEAAQSPILRWSAWILGLVILPMVVIAVISTFMRISQYGFTVERYWSLIVLAVAAAYGVVYAVFALWRRNDWAYSIRQGNIKLALGSCALAFILAMPIFNFGSMAANNQYARLMNGKVSAEEFDYRAMRFDFGEHGVALLKKIEQSDDQFASKQAALALNADSRWDISSPDKSAEKIAYAKKIRDNLLVFPANTKLDDDMLEGIANNSHGCDVSTCAMYKINDNYMLLVEVRGCHNCALDSKLLSRVVVKSSDKKTVLGYSWQYDYDHGQDSDDKWNEGQIKGVNGDAVVELRDVTRKRLYINGKAVGESFDWPLDEGQRVVTDGEPYEAAEAVEVSR